MCSKADNYDFTDIGNYQLDSSSRMPLFKDEYSKSDSVTDPRCFQINHCIYLLLIIFHWLTGQNYNVY